jgi:DNA helicase-2/ATP-dependent DNA helicase PcrA
MASWLPPSLLTLPRTDKGRMSSYAPMVSHALASELNELNDDQRRAVLHPGCVVVRAGPGSGKTRTLVGKVGYLLETQISARRGIAVITYTRHAAREITDRLARLGIRPGRRLAAATLHGWCLTSILRPFGPLVGMPVPGPGSVVDDKEDVWVSLLQRCMDDAAAMGNAEWERSSITRIRRDVAAGNDRDPRDPMVRAALLFDERMLENGWFDFESMIAQSLHIVQVYPQIAQLIAARYPWVIVDEYQDLGPVLHALVLALHESASAKVAAFGDPDQSVMGFTGADPRYLNSLATRPEFLDIPLNLNYRSGQAIIAASHAALNQERPHRARPERADNGIIEPVGADGGLSQHARLAVARIGELIARGVPAHQIAVLYPRKGLLLDELVEALDASGHDYVHERDERLPDGDLADFVRYCAARAVSGPQPIGSGGGAVPGVTLTELVATYNHLRKLSEMESLAGYIADRRLASLVNLANPVQMPDAPSGPWLDRLTEAMELDAIASTSPSQRDQRALQDFRRADQKHALTVADIAAGTLRVGKILLTTYHSAKGREWDVVILPGLIDGIMPNRMWSKARHQYLEPAPDRLEQDRRAFYVGLTRARDAVILIHGTYWETPWGSRNSLGTSRFAVDVLDHLNG